MNKKVWVWCNGPVQGKEGIKLMVCSFHSESYSPGCCRAPRLCHFRMVLIIPGRLLPLCEFRCFRDQEGGLDIPYVLPRTLQNPWHSPLWPSLGKTSQSSRVKLSFLIHHASSPHWHGSSSAPFNSSHSLCLCKMSHLQENEAGLYHLAHLGKALSLLEQWGLKLRVQFLVQTHCLGCSLFCIIYMEKWGKKGWESYSHWPYWWCFCCHFKVHQR